MATLLTGFHRRSIRSLCGVKYLKQLELKEVRPQNRAGVAAAIAHNDGMTSSFPPHSALPTSWGRVVCVCGGVFASSTGSTKGWRSCNLLMFKECVSQTLFDDFSIKKESTIDCVFFLWWCSRSINSTIMYFWEMNQYELCEENAAVAVFASLFEPSGCNSPLSIYCSQHLY